MRTFTETELKLRKMYLGNSNIAQKYYVTKDDLKRISERNNMDFLDTLTIPYDESLNEDGFFSKDENVGIVEHARYLPPLLHTHEFFELVYVREGECNHFMDNKAHTLISGDICVIAPNHEHALSAFSDEADIINLQIRTSTFEKSFFGILSDKDVLSNFFMHCLYHMNGQACLTFRTGNDALLKTLSDSLAEEFHNDRKYRGKMMDSLISTFFIQLMRDHEKDILLDPDNTSPHDDELILMLQYIQSNYSNLSLTELARFFGYSPRHITRILKESTGKNFSEITKELRMKKAAELLKNNDLPIPTIMETVGYSDISTFYKAFKGYYGKAPAAFRMESLNN